MLVPDINKLVLFAKEKGLLTSMTTNGILLEKREEECKFLFRHLDWFTLSLDGPNERVQSEMGRNPNHLKRVQSILTRAYKDHERKCKIKINTVVSKVNREYIFSMIELFREYPIERWKLFQFTPVRGDAVEARKRYTISDEEFQKVVDEIRIEAKKESWTLSPSDRKNIESAYFVIFPNGDIRISDRNNDRVIGNVLEDEILNIWERGGFRKELHKQRTECAIRWV